MKLIAEKTARPRSVMMWRRMDVNVLDAEVALGRERRAGRVMSERVPDMPCRQSEPQWSMKVKELDEK